MRPAPVPQWIGLADGHEERLMATARRSTDNDREAWWRFEADASRASWREAETPILDSLIEQVPEWSERPPWQPGYELHIRGQGGLVSKERRRYAIVGHGGYANIVGRHRTLTTDYQSTICSKDRKIMFDRPDQTDDLDAPWGRDKLVVEGDASQTYHGRTLMMSGTVQRTWHGGVMRLASMEGVICGGVLTRVIASPSATLSALMSGDVYGGAARVSAVRTYLAVLHYRAAKSAAWAMGVYVRNATFVIEPIISSPSAETPKGRIARKLARLAKAADVARMVCPVVDIMAGVITFPLAIYGIFKLLKSIVRKPVPIPPSGPPRIRTRNVGIHTELFGSKTCL